MPVTQLGEPQHQPWVSWAPAVNLICSGGAPAVVSRVLPCASALPPPSTPQQTDPATSDAFHVVIPPLPGYGFSVKPSATGWIRCAPLGPGWC